MLKSLFWALFSDFPSSDSTRTGLPCPRAPKITHLYATEKDEEHGEEDPKDDLINDVHDIDSDLIQGQIFILIIFFLTQANYRILFFSRDLFSWNLYFDAKIAFLGSKDAFSLQ